MIKKEVSLLVTLYATLLFAQESEENRDRLHSVKKVIASVHEVEKKELDIVNGVVHMFEDGKVTGQVRSIYSDIAYENTQDVYATALGGFLKYELAEYKGFSAGVEFVTAVDIDFLSGSGVERNTELSSTAQSYTQMSEVYLNYRYEGFGIRGGRQSIDTPLADSDDIRMVSNSFEAYLVSYKQDGFSCVGGLLVSWQGYDTGLDLPWSNTGDDGTYLGGLTYSNEIIDASVWYYNISATEGESVANNSFYGDIVGHFQLSKDLFLHLGGQYLQQNELDSSGIASEIYGLTSELIIYNIGFNVGYNKSFKKQGKQSFSGFGGGTLFTSMDNMIVDNIAVDRDVSAFVAGISYTYENIGLLYAYGDFQGSRDSRGVKEYIVEQNVGVSYNYKSLTFGAIHTKQDDKESTGVNGGNWKNIRVLVAYDF